MIIITGLLFMTQAYGQNIKAYQWQNRILIIEASDLTNPMYMAQLNQFKNAEKELAERKILIYEIVDGRYKRTDYLGLNSDDKWNEITDTRKTVSSIPGGFRVSLVGLDGGVKRKERLLIKKETLFQLIDSMPMRRSELDH